MRRTWPFYVVFCRGVDGKENVLKDFPRMYMRCNCFSHQAFGLVTFSLPLPSWFALRSLFTRGRNLSKFLRETRGWSVVRVWTRGIRVRGREKIKKSERVCQKRRKAKFDGWRFGDKKSDAPDNQLVVSPFSCSSLLCHFSLDSAWENPTIFLFSFHVKIKYVRLNAVNYIGRAKSHPWLPQKDALIPPPTECLLYLSGSKWITSGIS